MIPLPRSERVEGATLSYDRRHVMVPLTGTMTMRTMTWEKVT